MKKMKAFILKENEFSSAGFWYGAAVIMIALNILMNKILFGHFFWQDEIHNGIMFRYIYLVVGALAIWFVPDWCRNRSFLRMLIVGITPATVVMSLRWFFSGYVIAGVLLAFMVVYSACIIYQIIRSLMQKKKIEIIGKGFSKLLEVLGVVSIIGMTGYCLTGMNMVDANTVGAIVSADDGHLGLWGSNRNTLKLWKEDIYCGLSDKEKEKLFQDTVTLECQYFGIDPVKVEVEELEPETVMGYYSDDFYTITIRKEMFDMTREEVLDTLLHESHHAYVHQAVESVDWKAIEENKELRLYKDILNWKQGIENYISADVDQESYQNNPIEVAAREYSGEWVPDLLEFADSL